MTALSFPSRPEDTSLAEVSPAGNEQEWSAYVDRHPQATAYHHWRWRDVFVGAFSHECAYLIARRKGEVAGVLPLVALQSRLFGRFVVSLPFVNYGGVLADDGVAAGGLVDAAVRFAQSRNAEFLELRHRVRLLPALPAKQHKVAMTLRLAASAEEQWARLDRKVRNQIRKAQKSGLAASWGGLDLLPDFYDVFAENMRDLGTPVYSVKLFEHVLRCFPDSTRLLIVRLDGLPIAAALSLKHRDSVEVPWAASRTRFRSLCPNNLLYWTELERAITEGCRVFDFGRSTPGEGTFHFKRQWGAEPAPLTWEYSLLSRSTLPDLSPKNPAFHAAIALWKRLPVRATRLVGPAIVRSIP